MAIQTTRTLLFRGWGQRNSISTEATVGKREQRDVAEG